MAVFGLVRLNVISAFGTQRLGFINHLIFHVVIKLDTHANRHTVSFDIAVAVEVFGLIRLAQESHLEVCRGVTGYKTHAASILAEHFDYAFANVVGEHRIQGFVFDFMNPDRLDMARER